MAQRSQCDCMFCQVSGTKTKCGCWVCEDVQRIRDDPTWADELGLEPVVVASLLRMTIEQLHEKRAIADERERNAKSRAKWSAARQRSKRRLVHLDDDELTRRKTMRFERNARYHARRNQRSSPKP
jgi:hypothetical protein